MSESGLNQTVWKNSPHPQRHVDTPAAPASGGRVFVLVPCAGVGSRAVAADSDQPVLPKQYARLHGKMLVEHTLAALLAVREVERVLVVLAADDRQFARLPDGSLRADGRLHHAAVGGASRAESVRNGLLCLQQRHGAAADDWVLVHDAARCLVQAQWIERLVQQVRDGVCRDASLAGGLLAIPVADTLKHADAGQRVQQTLSRENKWLAQTPQMFRIGRLLEALQQGMEGVTDEASAMEANGQRPLLVRGHRHNFKVTYPEDFLLAAAVLSQRAESERTAAVEADAADC